MCDFLPIINYINQHEVLICVTPPQKEPLFQWALHKKGLQTTPQTPRQSFLRPFGSKRSKIERARGLIDSESWLSPSRFWYDSQSFRPSCVPSVASDQRSSAGESCFILCFCGFMILMRYVVVGCCGLGGRVVRLPRIRG